MVKEAEMNKSGRVPAKMDAVPNNYFLTMIDEGIGEADADLLIPHEDAVAWIRSWGLPDELPILVPPGREMTRIY